MLKIATRTLATQDGAELRPDALGYGTSPMARQPRERIMVIRVTGDLDLHAVADFAPVLDGAVESVAESVIVDLSQLGFLSVSAVENLAIASDTAEARGVSLVLVTGPKCVERALRAAGRDFATYRSLDAAISAPIGLRFKIG